MNRRDFVKTLTAVAASLGLCDANLVGQSKTPGSEHQSPPEETIDEIPFSGHMCANCEHDLVQHKAWPTGCTAMVPFGDSGCTAQCDCQSFQFGDIIARVGAWHEREHHYAREASELRAQLQALGEIQNRYHHYSGSVVSSVPWTEIKK